MHENGISDRLIKTPDWFNAPETRYPDVASVVRRTFANIEEAEDYAMSLGVHADYEQRLDIAQLSSEFLARLKDRELQMPLTVMVHSVYFASRYPEALATIPAMAENGVVLINPSADFWEDALGESQRSYTARFWSTPSPLHVFLHEYAHLFQDEATRGVLLTPRQKSLASSVSRRASVNVEEFLSEVYAGLMEGVQYDSDIMRVYHILGGKKL